MEHNPTPITLICLDMILINQIKDSHWPTCVHIEFYTVICGMYCHKIPINEFEYHY